jgi:hypothetical protein
MACQSPCGGGYVYALAIYNDELIAGGRFTSAGGQPANHIARWASSCSSVQIGAANPPAMSPYGSGVFRDVLENISNTGEPRGIGAVGTPELGGIEYAQPRVTFSGAISPTPSPATVSVSCTDLAGDGQDDCPSVMAVTPGAGENEYILTLSGVIPPRECTTLTFLGTAPDQKLQYQFLPGDVNLDGTSSTQDLLWLVQRLNDGTANLPQNLARYNINRSAGTSPVNTQDLLRLVQLLNGVNTTQIFNGATVAACP